MLEPRFARDHGLMFPFCSHA